MTWQDFWARSRWGSRWGAIDRWHETAHKGLDIIAPAGSAVPFLRSGMIVADSPNTSVGRYITVQVGPNDFDTYAHIVSAGRTGRVSAGETAGWVAGQKDAHGVDWTGPHIHFCRSTTKTGWGSWTARNLNPEPVITEIVNAPAPKPATRRRKDPAMPYMMRQLIDRPTSGPNAAATVGEQYTQLALYDDRDRFQILSNLVRLSPEAQLLAEVLSAYGGVEACSPFNAAYLKRRAEGPSSQRKPFYDAAGVYIPSTSTSGAPGVPYSLEQIAQAVDDVIDDERIAELVQKVLDQPDLTLAEVRADLVRALAPAAS